MSEKKDYFENKAKTYENDSKRVNNVQNIADGILDKISYDKNMKIMDFGSGTGLLTSQIAPYVKKIVAVDMSKAMNEVLKSKQDSYPCTLEVKQLDLANNDLDEKFDSIISSMTIHHVKDIEALLKKFYSMLEIGGTIGLADLETENGTFHKDDTGVFHFGFDKNEFYKIAKNVGFKNLEIKTISVATKPNGDFPIFLLTGIK